MIILDSKSIDAHSGIRKYAAERLRLVHIYQKRASRNAKALLFFVGADLDSVEAYDSLS